MSVVASGVEVPAANTGKGAGTGAGTGAGYQERLANSWDRIRAWDDRHRLWSDGLLVVLLAALCLYSVRGLRVDRLEFPLFQLALIAPLVWRRRAPSTVFLLIALVAFTQWLVTVPLPGDLALLVALFTVALYESPRRGLIAVGILEAGVIMASVHWSLGHDSLRSVIFLSGMAAAALFVGVTLRTWRAYLASLVERARQLEFERDQQAQLAVAAERSRIAREMHDVVAHNVAIMVTLADGARVVAGSDPGRARDTMAEVSATGRLALTDMRRLLGVLHTDDERAGRTPQPDLSGISSLVERVRSTGLDVELVENGCRFEVPPGVGLTLYRIVQESLTNVMKHADQPSAVTVTIDFDTPFIDLSVHDDGRSADRRGAERRGAAGGRADGGQADDRGPEGHGLYGMRERAAVCGGMLVAGPHHLGGWEVACSIRADGRTRHT